MEKYVVFFFNIAWHVFFSLIKESLFFHIHQYLSATRSSTASDYHQKSLWTSTNRYWLAIESEIPIQCTCNDITRRVNRSEYCWSRDIVSQTYVVAPVLDSNNGSNNSIFLLSLLHICQEPSKTNFQVLGTFDDGFNITWFISDQWNAASLFYVKYRKDGLCAWCYQNNPKCGIGFSNLFLLQVIHRHHGYAQPWQPIIAWWSMVSIVAATI